MRSPQHSSAPQLLMGLCPEPQQENIPNIPIPLLLGAGWVSVSIALPGERWDQQHPLVCASGCASAAAFCLLCLPYGTGGFSGSLTRSLNPRAQHFPAAQTKKKPLLQHLPCPPLRPHRQQIQGRVSPCREHRPHPELRASPPPTAPSSPEEGISEQQTTRQLPATHPVHVGALQQP